MMTNANEEISRRDGPQTASEPLRPNTAATTNDAVSPQEFYREMAERDDVRRILTRLAQVKDSRT